MNKLKKYFPVFLVPFLVYMTAEAAHYIFWGRCFFFLINSLILTAYIAYWAFCKKELPGGDTMTRCRAAIGGVMIFWFLCRCMRDRFLMENDTLVRLSWYAYYISIIVLPVLCYRFSVYFDRTAPERIHKRFIFLWTAAAVLIVGVMTNDLHQLAFSFPDGIAAWNSVSVRGPVFYAAAVFVIMLFVCAIIRIFRQCTLPKSKKYIWLPILPLAVGIVYVILYGLHLEPRINGIQIFMLTDTFCYLTIFFMDACDTVWQIATEIPDEETLLLHRIWGEIEGRVNLAEGCIRDAEEADETAYRESLYRAGFMQTYAKRAANLLLLGEQKGSADFSELSLALAESVEFLKLNGTEAMLVTEGEKQCSVAELLDVYREFQEKLESVLPRLDAVLVVVSADERHITLRISAEDKEGNAL